MGWAVMRETVLVVEDDKMIRELLRIYLEQAGYDVVEAADGKVAQALFLKYHPCLVVLDLMLPKLTGEEICHWIRD
jgi:two-component system alkaline phosphatase synthesis response regulator PhoP